MLVCSVVDSWYAGLDLSFEKVEGIYINSRPNKVVLSRTSISVEIIHDYFNATLQEIYWYISQGAMLCSLICDVGNILDGF